MYCNASGYKKRKTDADLEDELTAKDMTGFEVDFVWVLSATITLNPRCKAIYGGAPKNDDHYQK